MAKKRVTRKKLLKEPDEFITFSAKMIRFARENRKYLQWGGGICVIIILSASIYNYVLFKNEKTALELLAAAMDGNAVSANRPEPDPVTRQNFEKLVEAYPKTGAGRIAKLLYADILYKAGEYDRAALIYQQALADFYPEPSFKNIILSGLGHAHLEKGDTASAIRYFENITAGSDNLLKDEALFQLGLLYEQAGDSARSLVAFEKIVSDFSDSLYTPMVKEKIGATAQ